MSIENILVNDIRPWKNLYVNSINTNDISVLEPVFLRVYTQTSQNCPNGTTTIILNNIGEQSGNIGYSISTGVATINEAGIYVLYWGLEFVENANIAVRGAYISKNNGGVNTIDNGYGNFNSYQPIAASGNSTFPSNSSIAKLNVNDNIRLKFFNSTGLTIATGTSGFSSITIIKVA